MLRCYKNSAVDTLPQQPLPVVAGATIINSNDFFNESMKERKKSMVPNSISTTGSNKFKNIMKSYDNVANIDNSNHSKNSSPTQHKGYTFVCRNCRTQFRIIVTSTSTKQISPISPIVMTDNG